MTRPPAAGAVPLSGVYGVVNASGGLSLRTGPSSGYRLIRTLPNGTPLAIIQTSSDWFKVTTSGTTGWVNSWYVTLTGTPATGIARGNTSRKMVALTFDCGSDLGYTEDILVILEEYGIKASFSLAGDWTQAYPGYAAWIAADGHQLLNHTLKHPSYTGLSTGSGPISPASRLAQLEANETILRSITGKGSKPYWRPPYGDIDAGVLRDVGAGGWSKTIMWTVDSMGWDGYTADQIYWRVINNSGNGAIIMMHVGSASRDAAALERIIQTLRGRGYAFGTVAQVIATYPDADYSRISISPSSGPAGTTITVSGTGFQSDELVKISWDSSGAPALTTPRANSNGAFSTSIRAQSGAAGRHLVVAKGLSSGRKASRTFTLEAFSATGLFDVPTTEPTAVPTEVPTPTATLEPVSHEIIAYAASDASVSSASPDEIQPADQAGTLPAGGPDGAVALLTFQVEGIAAGTVVNAQLILTSVGDTAGPGGVVGVVPGYRVDEASLTYNTAPVKDNSAARRADGSAVAIEWAQPGTEVAVDVTGTVTADGLVTFVITATPEQVIAFASRESGTPARLVITVHDQ
jgi:peptidoglycan/xylan/chitin deacetylase (PgdA/CDA1 family)